MTFPLASRVATSSPVDQAGSAFCQAAAGWPRWASSPGASQLGKRRRPGAEFLLPIGGQAAASVDGFSKAHLGRFRDLETPVRIKAQSFLRQPHLLLAEGGAVSRWCVLCVRRRIGDVTAQPDQ